MNKINEIFKIQHSIIQAGMVWTSGWRLASAAANAGCLGLIGSASMYPDVLREHIQKCRKATDKPFGVNVALLYPDIEKIMNIIVEEEVKIVFTSAGDPKKWTGWLKERGIKVAHVVGSVKFARKSEDAGCDAVVAEGFEAGGHNGREETTTMVLIPMVKEKIKIPRFAASEESSLHANFKKKITEMNEGDTQVSLKKLVPVRLVKNKFFKQVQEAEDKGASSEELQTLLGRARAKKGMFEGDMEEGELEIGQVSAMLKEIKPVKKIVEEIVSEYETAKREICLK